MRNLWDKLNISMVAGGGGLYKSKLAYLRLVVPVLAFLFVSSLLTASISTPALNADAASPTLVSASVIRPAFALTLSVSPSVTLNLEPTPTGVMSIVSSTVSAATSSPSGYRLYLEMTGANSTDNSLIHTTDNSKKFTSSGTLESPVALANGTWGYAIAHSASSVNPDNGFDSSYTTIASGTPTENKFAAVPASPSPAQRIAETDYVGGIDLTVFYGARADYTTASGAYTNKVLYTALADNSDTHTMIVSPTTILPSGGESISLTTSLYSTAGEITADAYLLTAEQYAAVTAAQNPTPVSTYSSQKMTCQRDTNSDPLKLDCTTVEVDAGSGYVYLDVPGYGEHFATEITVYDPTPTMQNFTVAECNAMSTGDSVTMKDARDDNEYVVKKLADGKCWMTENLRLQNRMGNNALTSDDSNLPSGVTFEVPASSTADWCDSDDSTCSNKAMTLDATDTSIPGQENAQSNYGVYYNWYTATAGEGTRNKLTGYVFQSICPKGWRLPTGHSSGEFEILYNNYNSPALMQDEPGFVLSGYRSGDSTSSQGSSGRYWSSQTNNSTTFILSLSRSTVSARTSTMKRYNGLAVRCVLDPFSGITTMQEMTSEITTTAPIGVPNKLTDSRDNKAYVVKKMADGKIWMTENLRLTGSRTLTSSDSNVSSNWALPAANSSFPTSCTDAAYNMSSGNNADGYYYNWYAATAGTGTCAMASGEATASICPKGWRLPTSGDSGEFQVLYNEYPSITDMLDVTNGPGFVFSGYRNGGSTVGGSDSITKYGRYWSSTAYNSNGAYSLNLGSSSVDPAKGSMKYYGFTVRCVAE